MAEHEKDPLLRAQVGEPVPNEQALAGNDQAVAEGRNLGEELLGRGLERALEHDLARGIEDAHGHRVRVQIDAAGEAVLACRIASGSPLARRARLLGLREATQSK